MSFSNSGGSYKTEFEQGGDAEQVLGSIIKYKVCSALANQSNGTG